MVGKEKLHFGTPDRTARPLSRDNQAHLKDKSSAGQSHLAALPASSANSTAIPAATTEETMTQTHAISQDIPRPGNPASRLIAFVYGLAAYAIFFVTFLYAIGFVSGLVVPTTVDTGRVAPLPEALVVNLLLMSVFAVQHSVMARKQFKRWWTQFVPRPIERSTYVLFSSLALILLFWQWRALPSVIWQTDNLPLANAIVGLSFVGWLIVLTSTFLINHFELFGLHQVANNLVGKAMPAPKFRMPLLYKLVRHPIYLGFIIAFWATPTMTAGHLLFAAVTTAYIFVGILLEEHDLIEVFGDEYRRYRQRVSMLVPWRKSA
jgi:protein-S-isoprenylcysteine O-methyltransferase Ste14